MSTPRVTGLGGVFFKARDEKELAAWDREHLDLPITDPEGNRIEPWQPPVGH